MKGYLYLLGIALMTLSLVGGSLMLSVAYSSYQAQLHQLGAGPQSPVSMFAVAKWNFEQLLGGGIIAGGIIFGSALMALGWIGHTLERIQAAMMEEPETGAEPLTAAAGAADRTRVS